MIGSFHYPTRRIGLRMVLLMMVLGFASCTRKEPTPAPAPVVPVPPAVEAKPVPKVEFPEPELQARYETTFTQLLGEFTPPATGTLLAVRLNDGTFIGGALAKLNPTGLVLKLGKQEFVASRSDMDEGSQGDLYSDAFARLYAMAEIRDTVTNHLATEPVRYALKDTLDTLTGPGPRYPHVPDLLVPKGTRLDIQKRRGRWLLATAPSLKPGVRFWVDYFQTVPLTDGIGMDYTPYLMILLEQGILTRINPNDSEVFVDAQAWAGMESAVQEGISRMLAAHCAQLKQSKVLILDVKSEQNNQRLARYSRAQGYRTY